MQTCIETGVRFRQDFKRGDMNKRIAIILFVVVYVLIVCVVCIDFNVLILLG